MTAVGPALGSALLVTFVMVLVSSPLLYVGWKRRRRYLRLRSLPVETPGSVESGTPALVTGTVDETGESSRSPVAGEPSVLAAWDIREWRSGTQSHWLTEARGVESTQFTLSSDGNAVAVPNLSTDHVTDTWGKITELPTYTDGGIGNPDLTVESSSLDTVLDRMPTEEPGDEISTLEQRLDLGEPEDGLGQSIRSALYRRSQRLLWRPTGTRRYREIRIKPGDRITVTGNLKETEDGPRLSFSGPGDEPPLLSTLTPAKLCRRYRWAYWKVFYLPLALSGVVATVIFFALLA